MVASFESRKNTQAAMITAGIAGLLLLLMFLWKWPIPVIEKPLPEEGILVDLQLPEEPEVLPPAPASGGGGGGNPVQAAGNPGLAEHTPPQPGIQEDVKDIEEDPVQKESPPIYKPDNPKPDAKKINENNNPVKVPEPKKPVEAPPQPKPKPNPKAVLGRTTGGNSDGGNNSSTTYQRSGGSGTGSGVGNGSGTGGGTGTGSGGGNGSGGGRGSGPRRISGNRTVINPKSMDAGENLKGKVLARIKVSPDGIGTYLSAERGSTYTSGEAISIIREWLRRNKFNTAADESVVVFEFNFLLGG